MLLALLAPPKEFHQGVDYRIEARLDESSNELTGRARLRYSNHSPDALDTLYFHLHLNAFRPSSAWATRELQFNNRRFQDLGPTAHAFDRIYRIRVNGENVTPVFPFAPDSTVMAVPLRTKITPKTTATIDIDWTSRLSERATRRQGRRGRHYDWAHWYPRIAVYDSAGWQIQTLLPQGEFFGEFGSYDVTLDVAQDQIVAATGVPVSGDPGWEKVNRRPAHTPLLKRDAYKPKAAVSLGLLDKTEAAGRKQLRWRAKQVHHFAWSADPNYVYEGDRVGDVALHALFLPSDRIWAKRVIDQMKSAILFYDSVMGPYLYPQLTSVWRVDNGATEFPMFTSHSNPPAIVHETGHMWAHAMLANNEFKEGWLDEGLVTYLGALYTEAGGSTPDFERAVTAIARFDSAGISQSLSLPAAQFRDFNMYQAMTYTKPSLVLRMLRYTIGDQAFRAGLKLFYQNNKLTHVDTNDFKNAMETASNSDLDWFFDQWFRSDNRLDYGITGMQPVQQASGKWRTAVQITRNGAAYMPFDLKVDDTVTRVDSRDAEFTVFVETDQRPTRATIDPEFFLIDVARRNNSVEITSF